MRRVEAAALASDGTLTVAEMARLTGLSRNTVMLLVGRDPQPYKPSGKG